jgi:hypothetical protein
VSAWEIFKARYAFQLWNRGLSKNKNLDKASIIWMSSFSENHLVVFISKRSEELRLKIVKNLLKTWRFLNPTRMLYFRMHLLIASVFTSVVYGIAELQDWRALLGSITYAYVYASNYCCTWVEQANSSVARKRTLDGSASSELHPTNVLPLFVVYYKHNSWVNLTPQKEIGHPILASRIWLQVNRFSFQHSLWHLWARFLF